MKKNENVGQSLLVIQSLLVFLVAFVVLYAIVGSFSYQDSSRDVGNSEPAADTAGVPDASEEGAADRAEDSEANDESEAAVDEPEPRETGRMRLFEANRPGVYGRTFTNYGGGSIYDTSEIMGWFVPAGPYTVTAIRTDGPRLAVWYGSIEPSINSDGVPETMDFQCASLAEGESVEIVVPQGGCVYIKGTQALIKLDSLG